MACLSLAGSILSSNMSLTNPLTLTFRKQSLPSLRTLTTSRPFCQVSPQPLKGRLLKAA